MPALNELDQESVRELVRCRARNPAPGNAGPALRGMAAAESSTGSDGTLGTERLTLADVVRPLSKGRGVASPCRGLRIDSGVVVQFCRLS
jgi:hypothetical protein